MRTALTDERTSTIRPWVTALLTHPDFYADAVKQGLVRSPVEFVVALLHRHRPTIARRQRDSG